MSAALSPFVIAQLDCAIHCADIGPAKDFMVIPETTSSWIARSSRAMTDEWEPRV